MRLGRLPLLLILLLLQGTAGATLPPLQKLVDETEEGGTLVPPPGTYAGPVVVDKPMVIDGQGKVTIDAGGEGTVILLDTDGATIKNLHLTNSGDSANDLDSGVQVRGNYNVIKDNLIDDVLFGVDLQQSNNNIVRRNRISSKLEFGLGQRGDSVRLWYSFDNKITDNVVTNVRDMVVWYSANNTIARNRGSNSRYSLHFMYSRYNLVEDNFYVNNAVGIFLMYSDSVVLRNNHIAHAIGPTGVGIGFKETSDLTIENNEILYCASGLYIDVSPYQPDTTNRFEGNLIAYNGIGVRFLNDWHGNIFKQNQFVDNMTQIVVSGGGSANHNIWEGNYWSDYTGFDLDHDGIGDLPYELYNYADRLWQDVPYAQFFKGSPLLEVIDFLAKLAPFSEPTLLVKDPRPYMHTLAKIEIEEKAQEPDAYDLLKQSLEN
ncbi:MAG: nitrous oxide reductase family maturation protein NosD [Gammaproteobacteria bacterium]|nr:MAG: nitrous oxide reductase family maturation protein NosD [Gammaproteobacteria bacterium]RTZ75122.1 MAG: nitrous oxide reductase family maturation protein NosD [Gammaproteobacteria bacterium]RTZ81816.1 MAG: nitrous oxide reductase family maturation protein NosD [Gammaproteobacteria bacterium]